MKIGDPALDFTAVDQLGTSHTLAQHKGKWVIVYFYPKDDTPGCTKEACNFRDRYEKLLHMGVIVLGVSKDSTSTHKKFADKYSLPFPLLSDQDKKIIMAYNAWGKKKFMGREFEGIKRMTYLINPMGLIEKIYEQVNPLTHAKEIIDDLYKLQR